MIKFRAWIIAEKRYLPVDGIDFKKRTVRCYNDIDGYDFHPEYSFVETILEQWTGLKDANGVEIYEEDKITSPVGTNLRVFWSTTYYRWMMEDIKTKATYPIDSSVNLRIFEVTGNIHESEGVV